MNKENHEQWLAEQVARYGEKFAVKPLPADAYKFKNPIEEAVEMMGDPNKVIIATN